MEIKAGVMLSICLIFHQKSCIGMLINVMLIKNKTCSYSNIYQLKVFKKQSYDPKSFKYNMI